MDICSRLLIFLCFRSFQSFLCTWNFSVLETINFLTIVLVILLWIFVVVIYPNFMEHLQVHVFLSYLILFEGVHPHFFLSNFKIYLTVAVIAVHSHYLSCNIRLIAALLVPISHSSLSHHLRDHLHHILLHVVSHNSTDNVNSSVLEPICPVWLPLNEKCFACCDFLLFIFQYFTSCKHIRLLLNLFMFLLTRYQIRLLVTFACFTVIITFSLCWFKCHFFFLEDIGYRDFEVMPNLLQFVKPFRVWKTKILIGKWHEGQSLSEFVSYYNYLLFNVLLLIVHIKTNRKSKRVVKLYFSNKNAKLDESKERQKGRKECEGSVCISFRLWNFWNALHVRQGKSPRKSLSTSVVLSWSQNLQSLITVL